MADLERQARLRLRSWFAKAVLVAGALLAGWLVFVRKAPMAEAPPVPVGVAASPSPEVSPAPQRTLFRTDLIETATAAASAYASGQTLAPRISEALVNRRFSLRIAFGCNGPADPDAAEQAFYQVLHTRETIKLTARPGDWKALAQVTAGTMQSPVEAAEGFWISRPWDFNEECPVAGTPRPPDLEAPRETLGLVQLFGQDDSRVMRRDGRPYEVTLKAPEGAEMADGAAPRAYRLLLEGRLSRFSDDAVIHCWSPSPALRPTCIYAVQLDRIAFEDDGGKVLAEWRD